MPHVTSSVQSWHNPFDGAPRKVALDSGATSNFISLLPRATGDEILTVFPFTDSGVQDWGATAVLSSVDVTFSVTRDCSLSISVGSNPAGSTGNGTNTVLGSLSNAAYTVASSPYTRTIMLSPPPMGETLNNLTLRLDTTSFVDTSLTKFLSITAVNGVGGPPPAPPGFWRDFVRSHEVP